VGRAIDRLGLADQLAGQLSELPGAVAVVLGGSRATGREGPDSDWDLGLYYRGEFDPAGIRRLGHEGYVSELGEWGPIMNGGAWLTVDGAAVDVLFRDLDQVEQWLEEAREGRFEILAQNGYLVGAPTYLPVGELAINRPLAGELPRPEFSNALAEVAPQRWEGQASTALMFASISARLSDTVGCAGMLASAVLCAAHARLAARREWVLNEKGLVERAGLGEAQGVLAQPDGSSAERISELIGIEPLRAR
jgi:predicted nucleotidyltransferase